MVTPFPYVVYYCWNLFHLFSHLHISSCCLQYVFRHGGLGFIPPYISSEMTATMAAVSITAFIDLSLGVRMMAGKSDKW